MKRSGSAKVGKQMHTYFRKGVGMILHMTRWSRPEIQNSVRELARFGSGLAEVHIKAMHWAMEYCKSMPNRGWTLKPKREWDGKDKTFKFCIHGLTDSDYAQCLITYRSVSGYAAFLGGAPVSVKSVVERVVMLSVTEA